MDLSRFPILADQTVSLGTSKDDFSALLGFTLKAVNIYPCYFREKEN